jgi:hypothetical protein
MTKFCKRLQIKLEQKIENLEDENKKLKNQNQALIFIAEGLFNSFRIIGKCKYPKSLLLCPINVVKSLIINKL